MENSTFCLTRLLPPQLQGKEPAHDPAALFFNSAFQPTGE